jgi:nucleotide-binding universal stress UspA family protein
VFPSCGCFNGARAVRHIQDNERRRAKLARVAPTREVRKTIVVGVDGSEGGTAALEFAAEDAALRNARLRIVSVWDIPAMAYGAGFAPPLGPETLDLFRERAQKVAEDAAATAKQLQPSLDVEALAVQGQPADVLLEHAADAELIVVGRRGLGGFRSLLLGSVSQQVVQHATCPVVVVQQPAPSS